MKSRYAMIAAAASASFLAGLSLGTGHSSSPPAQHSQQPSGNRSSSNSDRQNNRNGYPYNPYNSGYPYTGIYSPGMTGTNQPTSGSGSSSSPGSTAPTTAPSLFPPDASATPTPAATNSVTPAAPPAAPDPELAAATAALDDAVAQLKKSLKSNPDYAAALGAKQAAKDDAAAFREKGENPAIGDISVIALRGLDAGKKITAIEREAMAKYPNVISARARLDAAIAAHAAAK